MLTVYYSAQAACVLTLIIHAIDQVTSKNPARFLTLVSLGAIVGFFLLELIRTDFQPYEVVLIIALWLCWWQLNFGRIEHEV